MTTAVHTPSNLAPHDPEAKWEIEGGALREKLAMAFDHPEALSELGFRLRGQLDRRLYRVHVDGGRVLLGKGDYYIPDIVVIPIELAQRFRRRADIAAR